MILAGQVFLLMALVAAGYASYAAFMGSCGEDGRGARRAIGSSIVTVIALTVVMLVLAWALLVKDFTFAYVAQYSNEQLPWQYSLSALWVGQKVPCCCGRGCWDWSCWHFFSTHDANHRDFDCAP